MSFPKSTPSEVSLVDDDGEITDQVVQLEGCLKHIFAKYCYPPVERSADSVNVLLSPPPNAYLTEEALEKWALETNGEPISQETKVEIMEFFDLNDDGNLIFKGFLQLYQLQTENDEEETWKDLKKHGFDEKLNLVVGTM
jgi:hypothetical protein